MEPVGAGGNCDDGSGERKEGDECGGKTEQHDEEGRERSAGGRRRRPGREPVGSGLASL